MAKPLRARRVAILATDGVAQVELTAPLQALVDAGAKVEVVAPKRGAIQGFNHHDKGDTIPVDVTLDQADPERYQALLLPGGVINPDMLASSRRRSTSSAASCRPASRSPRSATAHGP